MTTTERPDLIRVNKVSKRFVVRKDNSLKERLVTLGRAGRRHREDFWALKDVDITITAGTTVGLIGHNGSGKSTLLKVIGGIIDPTEGDVQRRGRVAALLELGAGFHPDLTGRENVFLNASILGLSRDETERRLDDILAFASIGEFIDTQVKFYSSGMYVRLAFAVAVHTDPDLLLVDEVLAVGDEAFQRKCMDKIRTFQDEGRTIVLVTHNLGQVADLCDRAVLLNRGVVEFDGDPRTAVTRFRDILEDRRIADQGASAGEETRPIRVVSSALVGEPVGGTLTISPGDDISLDIVVQCDTAESGLMLGVQVDNTAGQAAFGTSTQRLGITIPSATGEQRVRFTIKKTALGPGKYFMNVSMMDHTGVHLHDLHQVVSFNVTTDDLAYGTSYAVPEFTLID